MSKDAKPTSVTFRCPEEIVRSIEAEAEATGCNKTDAIVERLRHGIPSLPIKERSKLPAKPGIYYVFTPDNRLLYVGKADNLNTRWSQHHQYQRFIEASIDCRIGYFSFEQIESLKECIEEFDGEPIETVQNSALVTAKEYQETKRELEKLKQHCSSIFKGLTLLGSEDFIKKLKKLLPPRELQEWVPTVEEKREGITRSALFQRFGFKDQDAFETAAQFLEIDADRYLEELSGWKKRPIEAGSTRTRFYPKENEQ